MQRRLAELGTEARALGRSDEWATAFRDATAVVHLAGTLQPARGNSYEETNVGTVRRTIAALEGSTAFRIVYLSYVGADPRSPNDYLQTKGNAEKLVRALPCETVVIRASFVFGPPDDPGPSALPFVSRGGRPVLLLGSGSQRYAPVFVGDVVEVLARAARRSTPTGTFALAGPDAMTADEFVDALNRDRVKKRHLSGPAARLAAHVLPQLTPALVQVMSSDSLADAPSASDAYGVELHALEQIYAR